MMKFGLILGMSAYIWSSTATTATQPFSKPSMASNPYPSERSLYLNGIDISSARNQKLSKVDIHIDEAGNIFISAPHYDVKEEGHYIPLSKWSARSQTNGFHKTPKKINTENSAPDSTPKAKPSIESLGEVPVDKPGTEWPDADQRESAKN